MTKLSIGYALATVLAVSLAACGGSDSPADSSVDTAGISAARAAGSDVALSSSVSTDHSSAETANLDDLQAEEQRAQDVYVKSLSGE